MLKIYTQMRKHDFGVLRNGPTWGKSKKKKQTQKKICSKKIFKQKTSRFFFFTFQGLIHEINLIELGSSKIYKATQKLFLMC